MSYTRIIALTSLAMLAFASNSLLCRVALKHSGIDAASFTTLRILSGAIMLGLLVRLRNGALNSAGDWRSALALFAYAAGFSFAYISLPAATGALLLFGAVQATMIAYGIWSGERLLSRQLMGMLLAFAGLLALLLPGVSAPPLSGAILMLAAGVAWGIYSLRGKRSGDPMQITAGNFLRTVPMAAALSVLMFDRSALSVSGFYYALASGALASGVGYAIWYTVLPALQATQAATVQLSVPVIAAVGGIVLLGESMTLRLLLSSIAILSGIAMVILMKPKQD